LVAEFVLDNTSMAGLGYRLCADLRPVLARKPTSAPGPGRPSGEGYLTVLAIDEEVQRLFSLKIAPPSAPPET